MGKGKPSLLRNYRPRRPHVPRRRAPARQAVARQIQGGNRRSPCLTAALFYSVESASWIH